MSLTYNNMFPANHKTIFVLDHTPYFGISSDQPFDFDFVRNRSTGFIQVPPVYKSLWTCAVESALEYCRIVWDLFPSSKLIRFVASDGVAHIMNNWHPSQQNLTYIGNGLSMTGVPPAPHTGNNTEYTVIHGLRHAIEAASELTEAQLKYSYQTKLINRSRVICITSARDDESMKRLEEIFHNVLQQQNKVAEHQIDHVHLVIINTFPISIESQVNNHPPYEFSKLLTTEVHSIKSNMISSKLSTLILEHFDLASTTVTGIPMKEEQNASSSANYDVEIYHSSTAHLSDDSKTIKENMEYETVTLKWCTPRSVSASEMQNCTTMHRITPVDVNSRPSLCLINFLLNGRSVMLEMSKKSGGKVTSHLLAAHGGEIFIHTLCTARSVLEDPPSISEGCGGRVTDYRIPDFGLLIKQNRLLPVRSNNSIEVMKNRLKRHTKYWPLTISSTLIFNMKGIVDPIPSIIVKDRISDEEMVQCKQAIYNLISFETKHEPLPVGNSGQRPKGMKRDDQYKIIWNELEMLIKSNLHSDQHRNVYNCLIECHKFNEEDSPEIPRASVIRATTDSPLSPPLTLPPPAGGAHNVRTESTPVRTLLDIFRFQQEKSEKSRPDFHGRIAKSRLYPNLKGDGGDRVVKGEAMVIE